MWQKIAWLVENSPGWSQAEQLTGLAALVMATGDLPGDIVEIGSWCGRSTGALALAAKRSGHGIVHAVDLFPTRQDWKQNADGTWSMIMSDDGVPTGAYREQTVWDEPFQATIVPVYERFSGTYEAFLMTIAAVDAGDQVKAWRMSSRRFAREVPEDVRCRLAFLDGDHGYQEVCHDIALAERLLVPGGWLCFDDAFTSYEGVDRAIRERILGNSDYELGFQMSRKCFAVRRRLR